MYHFSPPKTTENPQKNAPAAETTETVNNPFKYTGQYHDAEIAQYYLRTRQYDPYLSRFTSRDPVRGGFKEPLTLHRYLYTANDPINYVDPSGRIFSFVDLLNSMNTMANRGATMWFSASRALWAVKRIVTSLNWLTHIKNIAIYSDKALKLVTYGIRAVYIAGNNSFYAGLVKIGGFFLAWNKYDPGGPQDTFQALIPGAPGAPGTSASGGVTTVLNETGAIDDIKDDLYEWAKGLSESDD